MGDSLVVLQFSHSHVENYQATPLSLITVLVAVSRTRTQHLKFFLGVNLAGLKRNLIALYPLRE